MNYTPYPLPVVEFVVDRSSECMARTLGMDPAMPDPLSTVPDYGLSWGGGATTRRVKCCNLPYILGDTLSSPSILTVSPACRAAGSLP